MCRLVSLLTDWCSGYDLTPHAWQFVAMCEDYRKQCQWHSPQGLVQSRKEATQHNNWCVLRWYVVGFYTPPNSMQLGYCNVCMFQPPQVKYSQQTTTKYVTWWSLVAHQYDYCHPLLVGQHMILTTSVLTTSNHLNFPGKGKAVVNTVRSTYNVCGGEGGIVKSGIILKYFFSP